MGASSSKFIVDAPISRLSVASFLHSLDTSFALPLRPFKSSASSFPTHHPIHSFIRTFHASFHPHRHSHRQRKRKRRHPRWHPTQAPTELPLHAEQLLLILHSFPHSNPRGEADDADGDHHQRDEAILLDGAAETAGSGLRGRAASVGDGSGDDEGILVMADGDGETRRRCRGVGKWRPGRRIAVVEEIGGGREGLTAKIGVRWQP